MKRLSDQVAAYLGFSLAVIMASIVGSLLIGADSFGDVMLAVGWCWFIIVGFPSVLWTSYNLSKQLGIKKMPSLQIIQPRTATIGGVGSNFDFLLGRQPQLPGARQHSATADLSDYQIRLGEHIILRRDLLLFLNEVTGRQMAGKPPFSRRHFVDKRHILDEGEYYAVVIILDQLHLISGRKQGRSGKLIYSAPRCMAIIDRSV